jgi:hypothetical protein
LLSALGVDIAAEAADRQQQGAGQAEARAAASDVLEQLAGPDGDGQVRPAQDGHLPAVHQEGVKGGSCVQSEHDWQVLLVVGVATLRINDTTFLKHHVLGLLSRTAAMQGFKGLGMHHEEL